MGMKGKIALGAVVGFVVIGVVSANAGNNGSGDNGAQGAKKSSASAGRTSGGKSAGPSGGSTGGKKAKAERAASKVAFKGDGDFEVGKDVEPGTYRTTGNADGMCYWERAKDASGETGSLLANDNVSGTSYVTIKAGDKFFKSSGCNDWEAVGTEAKGSPASLIKGNGGMYRVGVDIAPGTYRSTGNTDALCYWERAKDALHSLDSIKANNNVTGTAIVTISATDAYFKTTGCQDWKKTG